MVSQQAVIAATHPLYRPAVEVAYRHYAEFNEKHFSGALPPCWIECSDTSRLGLAVAGWQSKGVAAIAFHFALVNEPALLKWTVLHETIHISDNLKILNTIEHDLSKGAALVASDQKTGGHGQRFLRECNRIGKYYGMRQARLLSVARWPFYHHGAGLKREYARVSAPIFFGEELRKKKIEIENQRERARLRNELEKRLRRNPRAWSIFNKYDLLAGGRLLSA